MSAESKNAYEALPQDHERVEHYKPKFLARGGDHLVYSLEGHPNLVFKASTFVLKDILTENAGTGLILDSLPPTMEGWSGASISPAEEVKKKNEQLRQLRQYFGNERTLGEKRYLMKVPVTKELLQEIFKDDEFDRVVPRGIESAQEVWTSGVIQERTSEIDNPEHRSFNFGSFVEERKGGGTVDPAELRKLNNAFLGTSEQAPEDIERFLKIQDDPTSHSLGDILKSAETDSQLKELLQEFVRKIITYTKETGNILALAGKDNVILFKENDKWTYLLLDALPVYNEPMYKFTQKSFRMRTEEEDSLQKKSEKQVRYEKQLVMKTLNFVRTVNGLAASLGITERLPLISPEDQRADLLY